MDTKTGALVIKEKMPKRILIVEDSSEDFTIMEHKLNNLHAIIDVADNLETAYRLSRENTPDVIIADVGVPAQPHGPICSLEQVLAFVRYHAEDHCLVVVTGNNETDESDIRNFFSAGAVDYISKDMMSLDLELLDRIQSAFQAYMLIKENGHLAQIMVRTAKIESRQDKMFQVIKRLTLGVTDVRESERKLLYDQAFKAGEAHGEKEARKKRLLRMAAGWGTFLAGLFAFGEAAQAFLKGFKKP